MSALIEVEGLTVRFGGLTAVGDVSLAIEPGEIHGLIGPNGAGKTTFFNAVSGLVPAAAGRLRFAGEDISAAPAYRRATLGIRRTFQSVQLAQRLTVLENVMVGLHTEIHESPLKTLFGLSVRDSADWAAQGRVREILAFLGLGDIALQPVGSLSFAQQRYVEIARALASSPKLLMLDEPAAGLSPAGVEDLDRLLVRLRAEWKLTILLVEHVVSLVLNVCDRVTVLDNGRKIAEDVPARIAADPVVKAAYLGEESHA